VEVVPKRLHEAFAQREVFKKAINVLSGDNDSALQDWGGHTGGSALR
jgi:hypothetical protein